jgi:hypothetical protein
MIYNNYYQNIRDNEAKKIRRDQIVLSDNSRHYLGQTSAGYQSLRLIIINKQQYKM